MAGRRKDASAPPTDDERPAAEGFGIVYGPDLWNVGPEERLERWNSAAYFTWMGLELVEAEGGRARAVLRIHDHHRGGGGTPAVNGGVIAYVFDGALGAAVATLQQGRPQVTLQLNISYLRMLTGDLAVCDARVVRAGNHIAFTEAQLLDDQDRICATAQCTYRLFGSAQERPPDKEENHTL